MRAKKLFPELTFKRLWNKITGVEDKVDKEVSEINKNLDKLSFAYDNNGLTVGSNTDNVAYLRVNGFNYNYQFVADQEKFKVESYDIKNNSWATILSIPRSKSNALNTLGNYYSKAGSDMSLSTAKSTSVCSLTLPKGTYVIVGFVRFAKNSSGERRANIDTTSGEISVQASVTPLSSNSTQLNLTNVINVKNDNTTVHLNAYQSSGNALNIESGGTFMRAVKIG